MYFFLGLSSWNPLFRTPANTSLVVKYFEGRSITVSPFKILIPWLQRGICPVSYWLCGHLPNLMAEVCWGFRFEGSTDMETSFDPTNHPSSILNKAIFDPCVLQDQKWPCLFWVRNGSNNYCSPASPRLETHGRWFCKKSSQTPMAMQGCQLVVTRMNFQDILRTEGFKHPTSCRAWMVGRKHGHGCDILVNPRRRCGFSKSCFATYLVELKPNVSSKKCKGLTVGSIGREQCFTIPRNSALIPGGRCVGFGGPWR